MGNETTSMYAIVDVETTGGKFNEEGITEIAIYRFDGNTIVDQFSSLINPLREIQPFVQRLTGINSKMLVNAPKFMRSQNASLKLQRTLCWWPIMQSLITALFEQNLNV